MTRGTDDEWDQRLADIADRSAALRDALARAPSLDVRVPGCPDWTARDLAAHIGRVQRFWAAAVRSGARGDVAPPAPGAIPDPQPGEEVIGWLAASAAELIGALESAGATAPCWTWWAPRGSAAPSTAGAVARHQVQEAAVHAYDAQEAVGSPAPIPVAIASDGVEEFVQVMAGAAGPWPHPPSTVLLAAGEGPSWRVRLDSNGARLRAGADPDADADPDAIMRGSASDLVLALYRRIPLSALDCQGDEVLRRVVEWPDTK